MLDYDRNVLIYCAMLFSVAIIIAVGLHHHLRDKDDKIKRIPQLILTGVIVLLELGKQIRNFTGYEYGNLVGYLVGNHDEFSGYALPFHFCSFFFFWQLAALFTKGKTQKFFDQMSFFWSTLIAAYILAFPGSIFRGGLENLVEDKVSDTHTLVFHSLAFIYWCNEIALKRTEFKTKDWWKGAVAFLGYSVIVIPMAFIFDSNYCSVLKPDAPLPWLPIAHNLGYGVYLPVLVATGMAFGVGLYFLICGVRKLESYIKDTKWVEYGFLAFALLLYPVSLLLKPDNFTTENGPIWFLIAIGLLVVCMIPAIIRRIALNKKVAA